MNSNSNGYSNPIKINSNFHKNESKQKERAFRKHRLKLDNKKAFADPTIFFTEEQYIKFEEFRRYCMNISKCIHGCKGYISLEHNFCSNDNNEITALCADCMQYSIDSSNTAKEYVIWFNKILEDFGMSFKDGFPKLMKHELIGKWCSNCNANHTKMEYIHL